MAKIDRYNGNVVAFGSEAEGTERTVFGDTTQSDSLDQNLNSFYKRGFGIVGVNEAPTKQDFNAVNFTNSQLIAYLHQTGIAEWNTNQEYHSGSLANVNGIIYKSKTDNNVGNDPTTDTTNWTTSEPNQVQLLSTYDNGIRTDAEVLTAATSAMNTLGKSLIIDQPLDLGGASVDCLGVGLVWFDRTNTITNGTLTNYGITSTQNQVKSISDLITHTGLFDGEPVLVANYHKDVKGGGGLFHWDANKDKSEHNGGTVIDPTAVFPTDWADQAQLATWFGAANVGIGCWVRQYDGAVNVKWFGTKGDGVTDDTVALSSTSNSFDSLNTVAIVFNNGDIHRIGAYSGMYVNPVNGYILMNLTGKSQVSIEGNGAKLLLENHDIGMEGYGFSCVVLDDSSNVFVTGLDFDMSFTGANNSSLKYPMCAAVLLRHSNTKSSNINITNNTFKMFHPWGQYASTLNPYNGDNNNGFKVLPIFVAGDNTETNNKLLTNNVNISNNTFKEGHNAYGIWVWSCSDVKIRNNIAELWSGKKSSFDGATAVQSFGSIPFIRYIQFYADNVEISGNTMYGRSKDLQSAGYEGNSNFITLASNLSEPVYNTNVSVFDNFADLHGDVSGLAGDVSGISYHLSGRLSVNNNTIHLSSIASSRTGYSFVDDISSERAERSIDISHNKFSSSVSGLSSIFLANSSTNGNNATVVISSNSITGLFSTGVVCGASLGSTYGVTSLIASSNTIEASATAFSLNNNKATSDIYIITNNKVSGTLANKTWLLTNKVYITNNVYSTLGTAITQSIVDSDDTLFKSPTGTGKLGASSLNGGTINFYAQDNTQYVSTTGGLALNPASPNVFPNADNSVTLGKPANRWSIVYAGTGTINTSDAREKTFSNTPEVEKQVAIELKGLIKRFKFNNAIEAKGLENARIHYGTSAQEVIETFKKHGLDAMDYAMVCYDEWEAEYDEEGNMTQEAGNRYGIRYNELLAFIIAVM